MAPAGRGGATGAKRGLAKPKGGRAGQAGRAKNAGMEMQRAQFKEGWRRVLAAALVTACTVMAAPAWGAADPVRLPVVRAVSRVLGPPPAAAARRAARDVVKAAEDMEECRAVRRYFPLHEGDYRQFEGGGMRVDMATHSAEVGGQPVFALSTGEGEDYLVYAGNELWLLGESVPGYMDVIFESPAVWLDESLVLYGGRRTTRTAAWVWGYHIQLTLTVEVSLAPDVTVPVGTFGNCRLLTLTVQATVPGQGSATTRQRMELSPEVGLCRVTPVDQVGQWLDLVGGTMDGVPVGQLAAGSRLASPSFARTPGPLTAVSGSAAVLAATVSGSGPLRYQWMREGTNLVDGGRVAGATSATLTVAWVEAGDAGRYALDVRSDVGCLTSAEVALTVVPDVVRPSVTLLSPRPNARLTNATATVQLRATDNAAVREVYCQREGGDWVAAAPGPAGWEAPMTWVAGTNRLRAYAVDGVGNVSATQAMAVVFVVPWPIDLGVTGEGRLSPDLRGALLEVGRGYALTAVPAPGWLFSNWVGAATSSAARLSFVMQSNLVLRANFVPNPFRALRGSYAGLFYDTNAPAHANAAWLALTVAESGAFSGRLTQGRVVTPFSGRFDAGLAASNVVVRPGGDSWAVRLQLVAGTDRVEGTIGGPGWVATGWGFRSLFHAATNPATGWVGRYTAVLASAPTGSGSGMPPGVVTLAVSAAGRVQWNGTLADGTPMVHGAGLARNGWWPVYVGLYGGQGSVFGWMALTPGDEEGSDLKALSGLRWTKPSALAGRYAGGLTNRMSAVGSRYQAPPPGVPVLSLTNGLLLLSGGGLPAGLTNGVVLDERNRFVVGPPNPQGVVLSWVPATGAVGGSFVHPGTGTRIALKSLVLQRQGFGAGFFPGVAESGTVVFGPAYP